MSNNSELDKYAAKTEKVWRDKKHIFGLPISFTEYSLSKDRIFIKRGVLFEHKNETLLYRVKDLTIQRNIWQKLMGVSTIIVKTLDSSTPVIVLKNIKRADAVKEMLHDYVERAKEKATFEQIIG